MTKKETLQEEAKGLEGFTTKSTIAQLEKLLADQPKETEDEVQEVEIEEDPETTVAPEDEKTDEKPEPEQEELTYSEETDRTKMRDYSNKTRTNDNVKGALIKSVEKLKDKAIIHFDTAGSEEVSKDFINRYDPRAGGYFVIASNGDQKYIRKYEFEEFYFKKN